MTAIELKTRVYQQIAYLNEKQLEKLCKLLDKEFSSEARESQKRVGGKYKGQFVIHEDFDQMPDDFMSAFING